MENVLEDTAAAQKAESLEQQIDSYVIAAKNINPALVLDPEDKKGIAETVAGYKGSSLIKRIFHSETPMANAVRDWSELYEEVIKRQDEPEFIQKYLASAPIEKLANASYGRLVKRREMLDELAKSGKMLKRNLDAGLSGRQVAQLSSYFQSRAEIVRLQARIGNIFLGKYNRNSTP
jgi:hypothetical protein